MLSNPAESSYFWQLHELMKGTLSWRKASWARICKPLKEPKKWFSAGPVRQPYLTYRPARLHRLAESILGLLKRLKIFGLWFLEHLFSRKENQLEASGYLLAPECGWQLQYRPHLCSHNQPMHTTSCVNDNGYKRCCGSRSGSSISSESSRSFDDQKFKKKKIQLKNVFFFIWSKLAIYLSRGLHKGCSSYRRSFQPSKENIQHFKYYNFFLFFSVIFVLLNYDPDCKYGSGSGSRDPIESGSESTTLVCTLKNRGKFPLPSCWGEHQLPAVSFLQSWLPQFLPRDICRVHTQ